MNLETNMKVNLSMDKCTANSLYTSKDFFSNEVIYATIYSEYGEISNRIFKDGVKISDTHVPANWETFSDSTRIREYTWKTFKEIAM